MSLNNQAHFQSAKKSTGLKEYKTPNSKHKHRDNIIVLEHQKSRHSNRKSIRRNITFFEKFVGKPIIKKGEIKEQYHDDDSNRKVFDTQQMLQRIYQKQRVCLKQYEQQIQPVLNKMDDMKKKKKTVKQTVSLFRNSFSKNSNLCQKVYDVNSKYQIKNYFIKDSTQKNKYETKIEVYEYSSAQFSLNEEIGLKRMISERKQNELQNEIQKLQTKTLQLANANSYQKNKELQYKITFVDKQKMRELYEIQMSQSFVLKIQLNSNLYSGFIVNEELQDKRLLLNQDYLKWDIKKIKRIDYQDLKRFILLQLYRGWKKLLRKLSYQSTQYQVLFGQMHDAPVLEDLVRLLNNDRMRESYKKHMKLIAFYSEATKKPNRRQKIISMLQGFNNGLIEINSVHFNEGQERDTQLVIRYTYLKQQQIEQKFVFEEYDNLDEQKIMANFKSYEKRVFCMIQIPIVVQGKNNFDKYEAIYGMLKKKKAIK